MNNTEIAENETSTPALEKKSEDNKNEDIEIDSKEIKKSNNEKIDNWIDDKKQGWNHLDGNTTHTEDKKNGPWSEEEKSTFLKALKEHPPTKGQWSFFSRYIPSRDGYQCSAFYKKLVAAGEIEEISMINKKSNNNAINSSSNTNITNNTQTNSRKKSSLRSSPRMRTIISYLHQPHRTSLFDKYNISLINRRPPLDSVDTNKIKFDGSEYAYNNTLVQPQKDDFIINPKNKINSSFHQLLADGLNDSFSEEKYNSFSYEYYKFD